MKLGIGQGVFVMLGNRVIDHKGRSDHVYDVSGWMFNRQGMWELVLMHTYNTWMRLTGVKVLNLSVNLEC